jgi:hypothetical protein
VITCPLELFRSSKPVATAVVLGAFLVSLILPFTPGYVSPDLRVVGKGPHPAAMDKVEISRIVVPSPAECLSLKTREITSVSPLPALRLFYPNHVNVLLQSEGKRYFSGLHDDLIPWQPSIVIALRKLLI